MGKQSHPEITMHTYPFREYMRHIEVGDWDSVAELMLSSTEKMARAGADFIICPDNTIHQAFDRVVNKSSLPWLHIAEEVAAEAARCNYRRLGILGTRYLMEGPVYPTKLAARKIDHLVPDTNERQRINEVIFDELVNGRFTPQSRRYFNEVIDRLKDQGCDAAVLACTEIPLLLTEGDSSLPKLDSTRILARAALKRATD